MLRLFSSLRFVLGDDTSSCRNHSRNQDLAVLVDALGKWGPRSPLFRTIEKDGVLFLNF